MTQQEFDSLRVGSKVTNSNGSWNGIVVEVDEPKRVKVHWTRVLNGETLDDDYNFKDAGTWVRFVSNPETIVGLEEII